MSVFKKATREQIRLRLSITAVSGSGKSVSALKIATHLPGPLACIDTERSSLSKYAGDPDIGDFDVLELQTFSPDAYIEAIKSAEKAGYKTLVIDSLSHVWFGVGGCLEMADSAQKRGANSFTAWKSVTPAYNKLIETILQSNMHIIATMRAKSEYSLEQNDKGKVQPKKIGTKAILREDSEYEFDIAADMNLDHDLIINKSRCSALQDKIFHKPGKEVADILTAWLSTGTTPSDPYNDILQEISTTAPSGKEALRAKIKELQLDETKLKDVREKFVARFSSNSTTAS